MSAKQQRLDIHQQITSHIVDAIETAGQPRLPWIRDKGVALLRPVNVASTKPYNGINILALWVSALKADFPSNIWGTYRQWQERGAQVRRGEKSSLIVFYKRLDIEQTNEITGETEETERLMARASHVFNAGQVEGFSMAPDQTLPDAPLFDPVERAEAFAKATGARIEEAGDCACYDPAEDLIRMPERRRFIGTATTSPAEGFYSTLCHELVHWSGVKQRLGRDLTGRFGTESYAIEELVAELGAAFLCGDLGITPEPRADHAQYIANWLKVLKDDKRAIFTAASKASQAANWLMEKEGKVP